MALSSISPDKVHDIAETAMQGLLSSDSSRRAVFVASKNNEIPFKKELAIQAYDIAEAMIAESVVRL